MIELPNTILRITALLIAPAITCAILIVVFDKLAYSVGIVDKPTERKQHSGHVPLVGGVAMFIALASLMPVFMSNHSYVAMMAISGVLLLTGVLDDFFDLSPALRLLIQVAAAILMVVVAGNKISSIGNLTGDGPILLAQGIGSAFTVICAVGVINSINMLDGMDGLAGSILLMSFAALGLLAWLGDRSVVSQQLLMIVGVLVAFLCFNARIFVSHAQVFMGDSGSMFLGFILCWYCLKLSQGSHASLSPVSAGWIFGMPLVDTIAVIVRRTLKGNSPFSAGRDHLHHLLMDAGLSVNKALFLIIFIHSIMVGLGFVITFNPNIEPPMFWIFVGIVIIHITLIVPKLARIPITTVKTPK